MKERRESSIKKKAQYAKHFLEHRDSLSESCVRFLPRPLVVEAKRLVFITLMINVSIYCRAWKRDLSLQKTQYP